MCFTGFCGSITRIRWCSADVGLVCKLVLCGGAVAVLSNMGQDGGRPEISVCPEINTKMAVGNDDQERLVYYIDQIDLLCFRFSQFRLRRK